ncbi:hypothetical protein TNIN_16901 [Trichonephila inaurata madagascariensis]|uniref:Uncharacterized protein n=1 Tax=Trichonephila inaurata madagascariensis TaxID=2747483 RepID=A0A8X7CGS7_9ARAC|nr:hypothetical protein TNIN_16901 [Trichonephila inaurata madagascariensis]
MSVVGLKTLFWGNRDAKQPLVISHSPETGATLIYTPPQQLTSTDALWQGLRPFWLSRKGIERVSECPAHPRPQVEASVCRLKHQSAS